MDSFAMRHLILSRPAQLEPLSSMMVDDDQCVQRCLSTSLSRGEVRADADIKEAQCAGSSSEPGQIWQHDLLILSISN